ncbi:MAG: hypothetical protein V1729_05515 [Candidatus Woesearchaeota archaeon]
MVVGLLLLLGVAFLLKDLGVWNFWGVNWWTALILFFGLSHGCSAHCPMCKEMRKKCK